MVDVELHPHGIAPIFLKMYQIFFSLTISFLYLIYSLGGCNRNKTRPLRPQIQFEESGCNSYKSLMYIYILYVTSVYLFIENNCFDSVIIVIIFLLDYD